MRTFAKMSILTLLELLQDVEHGKRNYAKHKKCCQGNLVPRTSPWFSPQVKGEVVGRVLGTKLQARVIYVPSRSAYSVLTLSPHCAFLSLSQKISFILNPVLLVQFSFDPSHASL